MTKALIVETLAAPGNFKLGMATLNQPEALNGISLDMSRRLLPTLEQWAHDPDIALVILRGAGERAFCSGGDLLTLYESMRSHTSGDPWGNPYTRDFFQAECQLDYRIHTYPKPIVCWGTGIVMGGGLGLMAGASHRIVTETTRMAMPEISVGLFPDAGASWTYGRLPDGVGIFLALTASQLGHADCLHLGLADYALPANAFDDLLGRLSAQQWQASAVGNATLASAILQAMQMPENGDGGVIARHLHLIRQAGAGPDFAHICKNILSLESNPDPWLKRAAQNHASGAPGSKRLAFALQKRLRHASLADVFRTEYGVLLHCASHGDFQEGIRALLVDKDKNPRWQAVGNDAAGDAWLARFFETPWPRSQAHPLAGLGSEAPAVTTAAR